MIPVPEEILTQPFEPQEKQWRKAVATNAEKNASSQWHNLNPSGAARNCP
jgi:hypothetical protein